MEITALDIVNKAIELGFDKCGIIPVQMMRDYEVRLEERMEHFPQTKDKYESFRSFAHLQNDYSFGKGNCRCVILVWEILYSKQSAKLCCKILSDRRKKTYRFRRISNQHTF